MKKFKYRKENVNNSEVENEEMAGGATESEDSELMEQENGEIGIYLDGLIDYYTQPDGAVYLNSYTRGDLSREDFLDDVKLQIKTLKVPKDKREIVLKKYKDFLWAYDAIELLVQAPDITDIHCLAWNHIRVKRIVNNRAVRETSHIRFDSPKHFRRFLNRLAISNKINLSEQNAQQNFVDKKSNPDWRLRCNTITEFLTCDEEPFLYIRKEPKVKRSLEELCRDGMFSEELMQTIKKAAQGPIIISGESGSGKSILMNAGIEVIDYGKSIMIIQADDELFSDKHPDVLTVHTVEAKEKDCVSYSFHDIARNAMYLDRQYLVFSEVKGKEARDVFTAAINGIKPWLSLHAPSTRGSMYQLANYVKMAMDIEVEDIFRMLAFTQFTLIHLSDFRIDEITYMKGWDEEKKQIIFEDVAL